MSNYWYRKYQRDAKKCGKKFSLSYKEFLEIIYKSCHYCGDPPKPRDRSPLPMNGVDRVDNKIGYVISNCVPCCRNCNFLKSSSSKEKFLQSVFKASFYIFVVLRLLKLLRDRHTQAQELSDPKL